MMWDPGHGPGWHQPWWQTWQGLAPILAIVILAGVVIWLLVRMSHAQGIGTAPAASVSPAGRPDPAIEAARMRYARGEMDRGAYLAVAQDLGALVGPPAGEAPTTASPDAEPPADDPPA